MSGRAKQLFGKRHSKVTSEKQNNYGIEASGEEIQYGYILDLLLSAYERGIENWFYLDELPN